MSGYIKSRHEQAKAGYRTGASNFDQPAGFILPRFPHEHMNNFSLVANQLAVYQKPGLPLSKYQLEKTVKKAIEQGWSEVFAFAPDGKTPNIQLAQELQRTAYRMGLGDQITFMTDAQEYARAGNLKSVKKQCRAQGGGRRLEKRFYAHPFAL
jgi:hypothetical protein